METPNNMEKHKIHRIGLREKFNRKPMGFYHEINGGFRLKFSPKAIH